MRFDTTIGECSADAPPPRVSRWFLLPIFLRAGFTGGLVIDYPNSTKAKKYYLCLSFEHGYKTPAAKVDEPQGGAAAAKFDVSGYSRATIAPSTH